MTSFIVLDICRDLILGCDIGFGANTSNTGFGSSTAASNPFGGGGSTFGSNPGGE